MNDIFIGWKSEDCKLEVIDKDKIQGKSRKQYYRVVCNICKEDTELFPTGYFITTKERLLNGNIPCGCSKSYRWNKDQYLIRIKRSIKNIIVIGYTEKFKGNVTKVKCRCEVCGYTWETQVAALLSGSSCASCAKSLKLTEDVAKERICSQLDSMGYYFNGFVEDFKNAQSKFNYLCPIHGNCTSTYNNLVNNKRGCLRCSKTTTKVGYVQNKKYNKDVLYLLLFDKEYLKIGRTFNLKQRMYNLKKLSGSKEVNVLLYLQATHEVVYCIETLLHIMFHKKNLQYTKQKWSTELYDINYLDIIMKTMISFDLDNIKLEENEIYNIEDTFKRLKLEY